MTKPPAGTQGSLFGDGMSEEDLAFLDRLAGWIAERRMATPAVLFLESVKPMSFVGSQAMVFFEPVVKAFVTGHGYTRFATLMERRENMEIFLQRIEAADRIQQERERKPKEPSK